MIVSKAKLQDKKLLVNLMDLYSFHAGRSQAEFVNFYQNQIDQLQHRINTHDYKKEDEEWAIVDKLDKDWKKLQNGKIC